MDKHATEAPEPDKQSVAVLIAEFPKTFFRATMHGLATGMYFLGGAFACATVAGAVGNPIWRWGCFLWNLWN